MQPPETSPDHGAHVRLVLLAALVVALGLVVVFAFKVLVVLFAGVLFALVLGTAATHVARWTRLPRTLVLVVLVLLVLAAWTVAAAVVLPRLIEQFGQLAHELPQALRQLSDHFQHQGVVDQTLEKAAQPAAVETGKAAHFAFAALGGSLEIGGGLVAIFFVGVYGAAQPTVYLRTIVSLFPQRHQERAGRALQTAGGNLTRWLLGRLVAMTFVGVATSIAFMILHLPLALSLGILAGTLTFIEYLGAIASGLPPTLLAFAQSPSKGIAVLVIFTAIHVVEGYVLTPLLTRATVRLPPAFTLASQVLLGTLAGVAGLTFSTPLLVATVSIAKVWRGSSIGTQVDLTGRPR
jgi:predicted PurR-regulated permease PerM